MHTRETPLSLIRTDDVRAAACQMTPMSPTFTDVLPISSMHTCETPLVLTGLPGVADDDDQPDMSYQRRKHVGYGRF